MAGLMDCDAEENLEKELPENLKVFYKKFEITALKDKLKIVGSCKKCEKKITGDWKPIKVTSNFVSHSSNMVANILLHDNKILH